jgi:hypothetical protein
MQSEPPPYCPWGSSTEAVGFVGVSTECRVSYTTVKAPAVLSVP